MTARPGRNGYRGVVWVFAWILVENDPCGTEPLAVIAHPRGQARLIVEEIERANDAVGYRLRHSAVHRERLWARGEGLVAPFRVRHDSIGSGVGPEAAARVKRQDEHVIALEKAVQSRSFEYKEVPSAVVIQDLGHQGAASVMSIPVPRLRARLSEERKTGSAILAPNNQRTPPQQNAQEAK